MIFENSHTQVYLACGNTDLRKSIDGLAVLVKEGFNLDPFSPCLYVFCNRKRDKLKILKWDHNGFWLYYRRLEKGTFKWPDEKKTRDGHGQPARTGLALRRTALKTALGPPGSTGQNSAVKQEKSLKKPLK